MLFYTYVSRTCARNMLSLLTGFLIPVLLIPAVGAHADDGFDLQLAIKKTLKHNPHLYQFAFVEKALQAEKKIKSLVKPVHLEIELEDIAGSGAFEGIDGAAVTIALSSTLELGDQRQSRIRVANAELQHAELESQAQTLDILGSVTTTYVQILATQEQIALSYETLELFKLLHQKALKRVRQGGAPEAEALRAGVEVTQEEIKLNALKNQLERQKMKLASFWGSTKPSFNTLEGDIYQIKPIPDYQQLVSQLEELPSVLVLASKKRLKAAEVDLAKSSNSTNISWRIGVKQYQEQNEHALVAGVSLPLFSKSRNSHSVVKALEEQNALNMKQQFMSIQVKTHLHKAWSIYQQSAFATQRLRTKVLPELEEAMRLTMVAYERGKYRYSELIDAQQTLLLAKQQWIDSATRAHLARTNIETLTGQAL